MKELRYEELPSPLGPLELLWTEGGLAAVDWSQTSQRRRALEARLECSATRTQGGPFRGHLESYFAGELSALERVPVALFGTEFQRSVWSALREIPAGSTQSYGDVARTVGSPKAFRAVGAANRVNPVPIVVPCHRVVGASGSLTGFAGGLDRKRWLLRHEGQEVPCPESDV